MSKRKSLMRLVMDGTCLPPPNSFLFFTFDSNECGHLRFFLHSVDTYPTSFVAASAPFPWRHKQHFWLCFVVWTSACLIFDTWHCWQSCRLSPWLNFGDKLWNPPPQTLFLFRKGTETKPCRVSTLQHPKDGRVEGGGGWWRSEEDRFKLLWGESLITATATSARPLLLQDTQTQRTHLSWSRGYHWWLAPDTAHYTHTLSSPCVIRKTNLCKDLQNGRAGEEKLERRAGWVARIDCNLTAGTTESLSTVFFVCFFFLTAALKLLRPDKKTFLSHTE